MFDVSALVDGIGSGVQDYVDKNPTLVNINKQIDIVKDQINDPDKISSIVSSATTKAIDTAAEKLDSKAIIQNDGSFLKPDSTAKKATLGIGAVIVIGIAAYLIWGKK